FKQLCFRQWLIANALHVSKLEALTSVQRCGNEVEIVNAETENVFGDGNFDHSTARPNGLVQRLSVFRELIQDPGLRIIDRQYDGRVITSYHVRDVKITGLIDLRRAEHHLKTTVTACFRIVGNLESILHFLGDAFLSLEILVGEVNLVPFRNGRQRLEAEFVLTLRIRGA